MFLLKLPKCRYYRYRSYSSKIDSILSATNIRNTFLDFFIKDHNHRFIRSSPVTPFCDPTVPFVNAGMNQFKNIFLGKATAPCERAANSQKCIRISGKHNDLNIIGTDGHHHTFFEMLGNWSFGDYYKEKACNLAWELLTKSLKIDPNRLYVTYFGGDERMGLSPDYQCKEIWKSIGIAEDNILPFGLEQNFWEMGLSGPCGPCTEIHIDHLSNSNSEERAKFVNAGRSDLTELWNIVFIEYNRKSDGTLEPLHQKYVDTGMGFERLVAVMQGQSSNYDTDLFTPIFDAISKESKMPAYSGVYDEHDSRYDLDYAYRVVADHARMCSVCIADGMYPQTNNRLRKIARKSLNICENVFKTENLIQNAIIPEIVDILGQAYPELEKKYENIRDTFTIENEYYKEARQRNHKEFKTLNISSIGILCEEDTIDFGGFATSFRDVEKLLNADATIKSLPIDFVYDRMHVNNGLTDEIIEKIAQEKNVTVDLDEFARHKKRKQLEAKMSYQRVNSSLLNTIDTNDIPTTDYSFMYDYAFDSNDKQFKVKKVQATIKMIKSSDDLHHIVLDRTNFYHTAGGQDADIGQIVDSNGIIFNVEGVEIYNGFVFHIGRFQTNGTFQENQMVELHVNPAHRTGLSQHHTAMHLLQAAMKHVTQNITFQQSSRVSCTELKCDLGTIGNRIDMNQLGQIEQLVRQIIHANVPVQTEFLAAHNLYALDNVTTIPGEVYPDENIRVKKIIENEFVSIEPCCGTHAHNTGELIDFCVTGFKFNGNTRSYSISAVAGPLVSVVKQNEKNLLEHFQQFKSKISKNDDSSDVDWKSLEIDAIKIAKDLEKIDMPYTTKNRIATDLDTIKKSIHLGQRAKLRTNVITEMMGALTKRTENNESFVIHVLNTAEDLDETLMTDAEQVCHDLPVIVLNVSNNKIVHGRASIPMKYTTNKFNAKHWMEKLGKEMNIECEANRKKRKLAICGFTNIPDKQFTTSELQTAVENAKIAAKLAFDKIVEADQNDRNNQEQKLLARIDVVKQKFDQANNVPKLIELDAEMKLIRGDIKNGLFIYTTKKKCIDDLVQMNEQMLEMRESIEKNIVSSELSDSKLDNQPYIVHIIKTEHVLGNQIMIHATDIRSEIPIAIINISDTEVIGRVSIPSKYTSENFGAKHLGDIFNDKFDGKCIHHGERYDTSVCDFRLNKKLVSDFDLKNIFEKIKTMLKTILDK